jgi:electron transfer flavoprotein alpha/beta subunit
MAGVVGATTAERAGLAVATMVEEVAGSGAAFAG